jgi:hypothetical protein
MRRHSQTTCTCTAEAVRQRAEQEQLALVTNDAHDAVAAVAATREAAGHVEGTLPLRCMLDTQYVVEPLLQSFQAVHPDIGLVVSFLVEIEAARDVVEGRADAAILWSPGPPAAGLHILPIATEQLVAVVPEHHRLAGYDTLTRTQLAAEVLVLFDRELGPGVWHAITDQIYDGWDGERRITDALLLESGHRARLDRVRAGGAVSVLAPRVAQHQPLDGVVIRPITPAVTATVALAWTDHSSLARGALVNHLPEVRRA